MEQTAAVRRRQAAASGTRRAEQRRLAVANGLCGAQRVEETWCKEGGKGRGGEWVTRRAEDGGDYVVEGRQRTGQWR